MMALRSLALIGAFLLVLTTTATRAQDKKEPAMPDSPYYPTKVGTTWTYKLGENKFSMKVTKNEEINKQPTVKIEMLGPDGKSMANENIAVKDDGVYRLAFEGKTAEPGVKFLALPPKAGDTWEVNSKIATETLKGKFEGGAEKIKIGDKEYDTVTSSAKELDANGQKITFKYYFAKDIGMVKQEVDIQGQKVVIELEKFEPAKQ